MKKIVAATAQRTTDREILVEVLGNDVIYRIHGRTMSTISETSLKEVGGNSASVVPISLVYNSARETVKLVIPGAKGNGIAHASLKGVNKDFTKAVLSIVNGSGPIPKATVEPEKKKEPKKKAPEIKESPCWRMYHSIIAHCDRVLLYGPPGTGKTTGAVKDCSGDYYMVTLHEDSSVAEMLGHWVPKGSNFVWHDGVAIRAWKEGVPLIINEVDLASGPVMTFLHSILDDKELAHQTLPNGETVHRQEGFKCIATMNGRPEDLSEALANRFEVSLDMDMPSKGAIEALPEELREFVVSAYSNKGNVTVTYREVVAFSKLRGQVGDDAYRIVFREKANDIKSLMALGQRGV